MDEWDISITISGIYMKWKSFDSAPTDGTPILVKTGMGVKVAWYDHVRRGGCWVTMEDGLCLAAPSSDDIQGWCWRDLL